MDVIDKEFAIEMIKKYGEDRFYHSCKRTMDSVSTLKLHMDLNGFDREKSQRFLRSVGIERMSKKIGVEKETSREIVCRIAFGFVRYYKEFGLKTHKLPEIMNARMIFGETNKWVVGYVRLLETFPDWNLDKVLPEE